MIKILIIEIIALTIAYTCDYLEWGSISSKTFIKALGPKDIEDQKERARRGRNSEYTRSTFLVIISLLTVVFFGTPSLFETITNNIYIQIGILIFFSHGVFHYLLVGPLKIRSNKKEFKILSKKGIREYFIPYFIALIGFYALWFGIILVAVIAITNGISIDLQTIKTTSESLSNLGTINIANLQYGSFLLVDFGVWIASASQKYVLLSLMVFIFIVFEQRSILKEAVLKGAYNWHKIVVWIVLLTLLGFSLIYLPSLFQKQNINLQEKTRLLIEKHKYASDSEQLYILENIVNVQKKLNDHDLSWLILKIFTGYGNLATMFIIGGIFLARRTLLKIIPQQMILELFIPSFIHEPFVKYMKDIGIITVKKKFKKNQNSS